MSELMKGKWKACVDGSVDIEDGDGRVIGTYCDIIGQQKEGSKVMRTARLIAAAPEMYRILCDLKEYCKDYDLTCDLECDIYEVLARIDGKKGE